MIGDRVTAEEWEFRRGLGARMQRVCVDKGLTKAAVANRLDMAPPQLARYESGYVTPSAFTFRRIARVLDVSPRWLLDGPRMGQADGKAEHGR